MYKHRYYNLTVLTLYFYVALSPRSDTIFNSCCSIKIAMVLLGGSLQLSPLYTMTPLERVDKTLFAEFCYGKEKWLHCFSTTCLSAKICLKSFFFAQGYGILCSALVHCLLIYLAG